MDSSIKIFKYPGCYVICGNNLNEICHVTFAGNIRWLKDETKVSAHDKEIITKFAEGEHKRFVEDLDQEIGILEKQIFPRGLWKLYDRMVDRLSTQEWLDFESEHKDMSIRDRIQLLKPRYIERC